ncbi:MAG: hypothetical protein ACRDL8_13100 [Solirubrobacteraceae bacterium]
MGSIGTALSMVVLAIGAAVQVKPAQIQQLAGHGQRTVRRIASAAGTPATGHAASVAKDLAALKAELARGS